MKIIGLTGPIASGKDEVSRILQKQGAFIIDADKVAQGFYSESGVASHESPVWSQLVKEFGEKILSSKGKIDRKKLGEIVFSDKHKLRTLNQIVHPHLKKRIIQIVNDTRHVTRDSGLMIVINAAVLKEIGLVNYVDEVWVVMAPRKIRLERLLKSGLPKKDAQARLLSQMSQKKYLEIADFVINNNGDLRALKEKVLKCLEE